MIDARRGRRYNGYNSMRREAVQIKRALFWIWVISLIAFAVDWGMVGPALLSGDYDIAVGAYIGLGCLIVSTLAGVSYKLLGNTCPHCGNMMACRDKYCPHCGARLDRSDM